MAYFAKIKDGIVEKTIVADKEFIDSGSVGNPSDWVETFRDGSFRKRFGGIGFTYDKDNDVFIEPQPYAAWTLNSDFGWSPPSPKPEEEHYTDEDGVHRIRWWKWDDPSQSWKKQV